jgi:hypothetical protein
LLNLRDRARTLLQGLAPSPPAKVQSYNVVCPEGHRLRGQRTAGYQALRCPTCGEAIFVLPRSTLPEPPVPASTPRAPKPIAARPSDLEPEPLVLTDPLAISDAPGADLDGEVVWLDEWADGDAGAPAEARAVGPEQHVAESNRDASSRNPRVARGQRGDAPATRARRPRERSAPSPSAEPARPVEETAPRGNLAGWARRNRNLLLFLAVGLLIAATVAIRQWRQHRQDLPRIAALGRVEGLAALDEGKFDKAYQLLSAARRAVDSLGDAVEGASQIRQGAAEAAVFISLVPERLESILDEAGRYDPKGWPAHFSTFYKGRSIVIDAHVIAVPEGETQARYELDYQVFPDGVGNPLRVARIDTTGFRLFENAKPKAGDRVQFGAVLASFTYDDRAEEWLVGLEPDSGVFITHPRALEALGWPSVADLPAGEGAEP